MRNYILIATLHSGKSVIKAFNKFQELRQELQRERQLRAFYREAQYETRSGKLHKISF
jgi:hypothetical protein